MTVSPIRKLLFWPGYGPLYNLVYAFWGIEGWVWRDSSLRLGLVLTFELGVRLWVACRLGPCFGGMGYPQTVAKQIL